MPGALADEDTTAAALDITVAAATDPASVLAHLTSEAHGLSAVEAASRLRTFGPNAVRSHHAKPLQILGRQ